MNISQPSLSNFHLISFSYNQDINQFQVTDGEFGKRYLTKLLNKKSIAAILINKVLSSFNRILQDPDLFPSNKVCPGRPNPTVSQVGIRMAYLAMNMFTIFMILMIIEGYHSSSEYLRYLSLVFLCFGFLIVIGIVILDGEGNKNTVQVKCFPTVKIIFKLECFIDTLNKSFENTGLQWRFNHATNLIQLYDVQYDKLNQSI